MHDPAITALFLDRYHADQEGGRPQSLQAYQALFPGYEDLIAQEFSDLKQREAAAPSDPASRSPTMDVPLSPERWVGPYRIIREIGRGGQGDVYLAEDTRLHRRVALKVLPGLGAFADEVIR